MIDRARCIQIGLNIKAARKAAGMTVDELADAVEVARSAVHYWETGVREITAIKLEKVALELGVPMLWLLGHYPGAGTPASPTLDQFAAQVRDATAETGQPATLRPDSEQAAFLGHIRTHLAGADDTTIGATLVLAALFGFHALGHFHEHRRTLMYLLGTFSLIGGQLYSGTPETEQAGGEAA